MFEAKRLSCLFNLQTLGHFLWQLLGGGKEGLSQSVASRRGTYMARGGKKEQAVATTTDDKMTKRRRDVSRSVFPILDALGVEKHDSHVAGS